MKNKINIAEILKKCPSGMELDCVLYDNVVFDTISDGHIYPIKIKTPEHSIFLTKNGCYSDNKFSKCVIFPKGKTTWDEFVPPCSFNDGDIVATTNGLFVGIVEVKNNMPVGAYCSVDYVKDFRINSDYVFDRLATPWEKEKLFRTIKDNGYRWNPETKILETLTPNKFDTTTLKPFDKVLVRDDVGHRWRAGFYRVGCASNYTIPYEGNEHLLGSTDDYNEYISKLDNIWNGQ